jgi:alkylation response protein AidB-like acyl-CoA dehydrogenase
MNFEPSARSADAVERVKHFIRKHIRPVERDYWARIHARHHGGDWRAWQIPPLMEELKAKARAEGLWNLFLPDPELGAGLSTLEYAPVAEATGHSFMAPEVFNCSAPDSGNMEVLWHYGSEAQKMQWLAPLLAGEIRSVFCMTEPDVASSDATNMQATAIIDGDSVVLDGRKWWSSGIGDPRAKHRDLHGPHPDPRARTAITSIRWCWCRWTRPASRSGACCRCSATTTSRTATAKCISSNVRVPAENVIQGPGMRLRDRAGPPRSGPHPPLHALHRRGRSRARSR